MTPPYQRSKWVRVTSQHRCGICNKPDWCLVSETHSLCMRVQGGRETTTKGGEAGWIYERTDTLARPILPAPITLRPDIDVGNLMQQWSDNTHTDQYQELANSLGVTLSALDLLECAWAAPHHAWAFTMRDGYGNRVGIRLRAADGRKWAVRGSRQGVFLPLGGLGCDTAIVTEGPTDCAAALTLGYWAIGRPSCGGGLYDIMMAFRRLGVKRAVVVADNDDPGIRGAETLVNHLHIPVATLVLPCKDLRQFLNCGGTKEVLDCMVRAVIWKMPNEN